MAHNAAPEILPHHHRSHHHPFVILAGFALFSAFVWLVLALLGDNIHYFKTPALITVADRQAGKPIRLGGLVEIGSVTQLGSNIIFSLTDDILSEQIHFSGVLPDLFREGQGVVVDGQFNEEGHFMATRILAKHDENYMSTNPTRSLSLIDK